LRTQDVHYTVDEKQRNVLLTEDGYEAVEDVLQVRHAAPSAGVQAMQQLGSGGRR
jgi:preprotein translocase subunit SecA